MAKTIHPSRPHAKWWILYLAGALIMALMWFEASASLSRTGHVFAEIVLVLLLYGVTAVWLKCNEINLLREALEKKKK